MDSPGPGIEAKIDEYVREYQWHHWNAEADKWKAVGDVVQSLTG